MSKTPRTDAVARLAVGFMRTNAIIKHAQNLEIELTVIKAQFTEYVKAEDVWRDEFDKEKSDDLRIKASKLRMQAMEVLGL
jgi:hypothetical protein